MIKKKKSEHTAASKHQFDTHEFGQFSLSWEVWTRKPMSDETLGYPLVHCNLFINNQPLDSCWLGRDDTDIIEEDEEHVYPFNLVLPPLPSKNAYVARGRLVLVYVNEKDPKLTINVTYGPVKSLVEETVVLIDPPDSSGSSRPGRAASSSSSDSSGEADSSTSSSGSSGSGSKDSSGSASDEKKSAKGRGRKARSTQAGK